MKTNPTNIISLQYDDMFHEVFQLFYLAKMYDEDLRSGQNYSRLKKCISIGILDFKLLESESYHSVYRLRNEKGEVLRNLNNRYRFHFSSLHFFAIRTSRLPFGNPLSSSSVTPRNSISRAK